MLRHFQCRVPGQGFRTLKRWGYWSLFRIQSLGLFDVYVFVVVEVVSLDCEFYFASVS